MLFRIVLILTVINLARSAQIIFQKKDQEYCFAQDANPYELMSSKTAYEFVHGNWIPHKIPSNFYNFIYAIFFLFILCATF